MNVLIICNNVICNKVFIYYYGKDFFRFERNNSQGKILKSKDKFSLVQLTEINTNIQKIDIASDFIRKFKVVFVRDTYFIKKNSPFLASFHQANHKIEHRKCPSCVYFQLM